MAIEQVYMIRHNVTGRMYIGRSKRMDALDDNEALYAYTLLSKIFGNRLKTEPSR